MGRPRDRVLIPGANNPRLDLPGPNARDSGLYYVVITTPFGIITNYVATVEVKIPFSLVGLPIAYLTASLTCKYLELPEILSPSNPHPISSVG